MANADNTTNPSLRWTPRRLLREIIANADLLDVVTHDECGWISDRWLLVRAPWWLLDLLAKFEAEREDLEDDEREPDVDDEPSLGSSDKSIDQGDWGGPALLAHEVDREDDGDSEPNLAHPEHMVQPDPKAQMMTVTEFRRR